MLSPPTWETTTRLDQAQTLPLCRCGRGTQLKYVRHGFNGFESREAPLLSTQDTYITAIQLLSARYCCCCECKKSNIVRLWASPAVGSAHGAPQTVEKKQRKQQRAGTATAATHVRIKGLRVSAASTPVARTQATIPHHLGPMLLLLFHRF